MAGTDGEEVLLRVEIAPARRFVAMALSALIGLWMIYVGLWLDVPSTLWRAGLVAVGGLALVQAVRIRAIAVPGIELTATELREIGGRRIAALDGVVEVQRSFGLFKPMNGFVLHLAAPARAAMVPGVWWRFGRRVAVGGMLPRGGARQIALRMEAQVKARAPGGVS